LQHVRSLVTQLQQGKTTQHDDSLDPQALRTLLNDLLVSEAAELQRLETERAELAKLPKRRAKQDKRRARSAAEELSKLTGLLEQLCRLEAAWLRQFTDALGWAGSPEIT